VPGLVVAIDGTRILGCAWHPHFQSYHVLVHVVAGPWIVAGVVADEKLELEGLPATGVGHGFTVDLAGATDRRLLIGETDEWFDLPQTSDRRGADITLEEIIGVPGRRPWVSGKIYFDALLAGLSIETIVDLFFRDCLDRPADPEGLLHYSRRIREGSLTFEALRKILVNSQEYKVHWRQASAAPGAIFSQRIVLRAGKELNAGWQGGAERETCISLRRLMTLSGIDFVAAAYAELLGEPPAAPDLWCHVAELRRGRQRLDIIRELSERPAALARSIGWSDVVVEREREPAATALPVAGATAPAASDLLRLEGMAFVTASCGRLLGRPPSAQEALFLCERLSGSQGKLEILEYLAADPGALPANVRRTEPFRTAPRPAVNLQGRTAAGAGRAATSASRRPAATSAAAVRNK
jgi:hypothetical protein